MSYGVGNVERGGPKTIYWITADDDGRLVAKVIMEKGHDAVILDAHGDQTYTWRGIFWNCLIDAVLRYEAWYAKLS